MAGHGLKTDFGFSSLVTFIFYIFLLILFAIQLVTFFSKIIYMRNINSGEISEKWTSEEPTLKNYVTLIWPKFCPSPSFLKLPFCLQFQFSSNIYLNLKLCNALSLYKKRRISKHNNVKISVLDINMLAHRAWGPSSQMASSVQRILKFWANYVR